MSFHEKSAWIMFFGLLISSSLYFGLVMVMSDFGGQLVLPNIPTLVVYTILLTFIATVGHIVIAILSPKDANAEQDERERGIVHKSSHISGNILGFGIICSLLLYLYSTSGALLFYSAFASLIISQTSEYFLHIYYHRRSFI